MMQRQPDGQFRLNFLDSPIPARMEARLKRASPWNLAHVAYAFAAVNVLSGLALPASTVLEQIGWCLITGALGVLPMRLTLRRLQRA